LKVCILGGAGYIGTSLQKLLPEATIFDKTTGTDVRNIEAIGDGYDVVVYLAALRLRESEQNPDEAMEVNYQAAVRLSKTTRAHFIFASSCSIYGTQDGYATEDSPVYPTSTYAKSKVLAERELGDATILRFATAYGVNEKTRSDLLLHEFIAQAKEGIIKIQNPEAYRPICHVDDIARAITRAAATQPTGIFNIGGHNFTKLELAKMVQDVIPCKITISDTITDTRNYRVSFEKAYKELGWFAVHDPTETILKLA
jgi:nucleoside-diphosphate-sugar epimerase